LPFYVYVIHSEISNKTYVGQTSNLKNRILQHNDPENRFSHFTKRYKGPWTLIYSEEFTSRKEAITREKYFKSGSGRRLLAKVQQMAVNPPARFFRTADIPPAGEDFIIEVSFLLRLIGPVRPESLAPWRGLPARFCSPWRACSPSAKADWRIQVPPEEPFFFWQFPSNRL
jgi:putative endonuclease